MAESNQELLAALRFTLGIALLGVFGGLAMLLYLCYGGVLPTSSDPATGHIIELRVHGSTLYMTEFQQWVSKRAIGLGLVVGLAAKFTESWLRRG